VSLSHLLIILVVLVILAAKPNLTGWAWVAYGLLCKRPRLHWSIARFSDNGASHAPKK
jgi:hypothetical protein